MSTRACGCAKIKKLNTFDWLCDLPEAQASTDYVEVQFKNTRKGYYLNSNKIPLQRGDLVAVESSPGHDIGEVTLTGYLVLKQMKKVNYRYEQQEVRRIYRKARPVDLDKYAESKAREHDTMLRARKIAEELKLNMKIGDVEYQGDGNKAIFYYIADDRVDFRQLIRVLADTFHVRIEMKQIGARQEAGRIGGIGPCGREMCCSAWMTNFVSVSTSAARYQDLSLNPQKLAGQCGKLKCCLNYETDMYVEAQKGFPAKDIVLETKDARYYQIKTDLFKRLVCYSTAKDSMANVVNIPVERALQIIALNKKGIRVDALSEQPEEKSRNEFGDVLSSDLQRFDKKRNKENKKRKDFRNNQDNNTSREADNRTDKNRKNRSRNRGRQNDNNNRDNSNRNRNNDHSRNQNNPDPK
ncbi:MAG: regulatory iron-sulfur-containing complex subunit RicT [Bacteroidales bacterium]|nr:regulatory iron-sulfur-containing complex subunit RicT [Bacteroidales bacterium]